MENLTRDFYDDVRQKKQLAAMARYRKSGARTHYCSLPSDNMTNKQWRGRNGKVMTYDLATPKSWEQFTSMPLDLQSEYITRLRDEYGIGLTNIAQMFGQHGNFLKQFFQKNKIEITFKRGRISREKLSRWNNFAGISNNNPIEYGEAVWEDIVKALQEPPTLSLDMSAENPEGMSVVDFSIAFEGILDLEDIANSLRVMIGCGKIGRLEFSYKQI